MGSSCAPFPSFSEVVSHTMPTASPLHPLKTPPPPCRPVSSFALGVGAPQKKKKTGHIVFPKCMAKERAPVYLTTNSSLVDVTELSSLLSSTGQNCLLFPSKDGYGCVDAEKLRVAVQKSTVVVSAFLSPGPTTLLRCFLFGERPKLHLVGFGRAISDGTLTASIHDIAVSPPFQNQGIGRKIVQKIIRILRSRGIDDISILCFEKQRPFFQACGFANDTLNSTTMIYSGKAKSSQKETR